MSDVNPYILLVGGREDRVESFGRSGGREDRVLGQTAAVVALVGLAVDVARTAARVQGGKARHRGGAHCVVMAGGRGFPIQIADEGYTSSERCGRVDGRVAVRELAVPRRVQITLRA